ncbi:MAG TPA: 5-methyltetrahydropteroyltriglutamate--homocysteine S-methyltransferase [Burkholderiales bacterium]|jgi:5-methyltetrahydropteroyltriglutamate--homocysteine methyltransferase|nr:5-methyltetrahydropteroyltriglutamate--homocysteine S-methyltransferase [Burkholderiales bacterium]
MVTTHNLGFPRIGRGRELKRALEAFWAGKLDEPALHEAVLRLRAGRRQQQRQAGIDLVPVGDFALYDHVLATTLLVGAVPPRFAGIGGSEIELEFALARGTRGQPAMEMTKWFDTNYHYIVPEFSAATEFHIASTRLFDEIDEARACGMRSKAVLLGPLSYLYLGKETAPGFDRLDLLPRLLPVYREIVARIGAMGVEWVQIDEPILALDLPPRWTGAFATTYGELAPHAPPLLLTTYFGAVDRQAALLKKLPVAGLHLDLARAPQQLDAFLPDYPDDKILSLGVIDGRNVWRSDLRRILAQLRPAYERLGERLWLAPGCSLLHVPIDLALETELDPELRQWLAFAVQKLEEIDVLRRGLSEGEQAIRSELAASDRAAEARRTSSRTHDEAVRQRLRQLNAADARRATPFVDRKKRQQERLQLPLLPTTTIGSFPQTPEIRAARARFRGGALSAEDYRISMRDEIRAVVERQEAIGLDVLVHGEAERNDMVEYFGEQLAGFMFTHDGWVQSYGSRCVKPPIIFGDVSRPAPMTVAWTSYAQSLTERPMKGMLTGPVTILQWSFVRDDQPRAETALQIALAIRDEVCDLERAGIGIIQIDEPAFREGLPFRSDQRRDYLEWAVRAFRVASSGVGDATQIHTHMCYSEFNDILPAIAQLDADVITIETSRSRMELLKGFAGFNYPNDIGPGVYDIHSPRVPDETEMQQLLETALRVIPAQRLWVNPDCGLKTRGWPETQAALRHMVDAARVLRERLQSPADAERLSCVIESGSYTDPV